MVTETQNSQWFDAASSGNIKELNKIIKSGINLNIKNDDGKTALILAAEEGLSNVVIFLLGINNENVLDLVIEWKKKDHDLNNEYIKQWKNNWITTDINAKDKTGKTALLYAVKEGHYKTVKLLIDNGADVNASDNDENTPLIFAVDGRHTDIVKWLIDAGADVNAISRIKYSSHYDRGTYQYSYFNSGGNSALISAVEIGSINITRWLIKAGADVDVRNSRGKTPLIIASENGFTTIAELLIKVDANVCGRDRSGKTALDHAQIKKFLDIEDLLRNAGKKIQILK